MLIEFMYCLCFSFEFLLTHNSNCNTCFASGTKWVWANWTTPVSYYYSLAFYIRTIKFLLPFLSVFLFNFHHYTKCQQESLIMIQLTVSITASRQYIKTVQLYTQINFTSPSLISHQLYLQLRSTKKKLVLEICMDMIDVWNSKTKKLAKSICNWM